MDRGVCLTECGEGFLQMLLAMTDRYKTLPQPLFANYPSFCFSPAAEGLSRTDVGDKRSHAGVTDVHSVSIKFHGKPWLFPASTPFFYIMCESISVPG